MQNGMYWNPPTSLCPLMKVEAGFNLSLRQRIWSDGRADTGVTTGQLSEPDSSPGSPWSDSPDSVLSSVLRMR